MNTAGIDQTVSERQPFRGIVVSADDQYLKSASCQRDQKLIKQLNRLGGRHRLVIHIAGDHHRIRMFLIEDIQYFFQNVLLVFQHGVFIHALSDMKIGQVNQFHSFLPFIEFLLLLPFGSLLHHPSVPLLQHP